MNCRQLINFPTPHIQICLLKAINAQSLTIAITHKMMLTRFDKIYPVPPCSVNALIVVPAGNNLGSQSSRLPRHRSLAVMQIAMSQCKGMLQIVITWLNTVNKEIKQATRPKRTRFQIIVQSSY